MRFPSVPRVKAQEPNPTLLFWGIGSAVLSVLAIVFRVPIVGEASILAWLTYIGLALSWVKLPKTVKKFFCLPGVRWLVDAGVSLGVPVFMGATVTGITAGMIVGIWTGVGLEWEAHKLYPGRRPG